MTNDVKKKGADTFAGAFAESFGGSLATATGAAWSFEIQSNPEAAKGTQVHFRVTAEGGLTGECYLEFYAQQVAELTAKINKDQTAATEEEQTQALAAFLSSTMTELASSLADKYGDIVFKVDRVAGLAFGGMFLVPLASSQENVQVLLYFATQLLESLAGTQEVVVPPRASETTAFAPKNLKLVMDVELNVSLRFGQRQMPLRDVLELNNGSVIELDRMVDEPVELFLDGKLIARGEAVVVDGNYGLRITEIPQPVTSHFFN
jgi:flagellar motor switch protein FliN/FliY